MPGIVGLLTRLPRERVESALLAMVDSICHEPFYETGTWIDEDLGVYVGWAARKGSFGAGMPLRNGRGDVVLVFSGEEFPEPETRRRLQRRGLPVDEPEGAYLVHLGEEDPAFPAGLNGRFHGLLIDRRLGTATLFNDRYGMHRVYYHEAPDAFHFAAEAKAILAVRPELRSLDPRGLGEFVACGSVLENRSLFRDIHVLPGGSAWVFRNGAPERRRAYFHPREWESQSELDRESYYRELRAVFAQNLPRYFQGRARVGMSLTGGLDTRMIMAWHKAAAGSLPCYTFGGMFRDCQDVLIARRVARLCDQPHEVIPVGPEFLARFAHYAERAVYLTDGCVDVSRSPDLYINEKAREIAPVRMTGNYGGELLRGVRAFKATDPTPGLFSPEVLPFIRQAKETYAGLLAAHPATFALFKQAPWHHHGVLALEETQLSMRSPYLDNDLVRVVFRAPRSILATADACLRLLADGDAALANIRTDRGLMGDAWTLSGAAGRATLELLFRAEYAYDMGMPQWLARLDHRLSRLRVERFFLGRHKVSHFRIWYRDALSTYVREVLLDRQSRGRSYLEGKRVEEIVEAHIKGKRNHTTAVHAMLTLEILHRLLLDPRPSSPEGAPTVVSDTGTLSKHA